MTATGFRITSTFRRPLPSLVQRFRDLPPSTIGDAMQRTAALPSRLRSLNGRPLLGPAYTVDVPAGDNLLFYYAIDHAEPGDVLVVAGGGFTERALCGEIMARFAQARGLAGFVIDGAVRDSAELAAMDFPVYAVATTPNGPYKNGPGTINEPIGVGDRVVAPGDIIVGDSTGLVSVPSGDASTVADLAHGVVAKEAALLARIDQGRGLDLAWMYDALAAAGVVAEEA